MTSEQSRSFQFDLKEVFALIAIVAVLLFVVPIAYRSTKAATTLYVLLGAMQVICSAITYKRFRMTGAQRRQRKEQPYELALIASVLTLGTWVLTTLGFAEDWLRTDIFPSFDTVMWLTLLCTAPHIPVFFVNITCLALMRDRPNHGALIALLLLCLTNTILMFAAVLAFVGSHIPP
jgi:hypothetical protein